MLLPSCPSLSLVSKTEGRETLSLGVGMRRGRYVPLERGKAPLCTVYVYVQFCLMRVCVFEKCAKKEEKRGGKERRER